MPDLDSARELAVLHARHRRARRPPDRLRADGDGRAARRARWATRSRWPRRARCWPGAGRSTSASSCSARPRAWRCSPTSASTSPRAAGSREEAVASGAAVRALERLVEAQGGDPRVAERPWEVLETAPVIVAVPAPRAGLVARCGALAIGRAAMRLGAGRERKEDPIDHAVGIVVHAKPGDDVEAGEPLAHVHARDGGARRGAPSAEVLRRLRARRRPGRAPPAPARDDRLMPELPEVETVRRRLLPHLSGRTLAEVEMLRSPADRSGAAGGGRRAPAGRAHRDARPARQVPHRRVSTTARRCSCTCA